MNSYIIVTIVKQILISTLYFLLTQNDILLNNTYIYIYNLKTNLYSWKAMYTIVTIV